ncbi:spidroin-1-like [Numida meleagris]|uniref:spidroin-1-like n=1 Tax=Numida meleagris TaxID=8996 RepID=UPI000B3E3122|nr:spidroin-1-like [Numida meleagris]
MKESLPAAAAAAAAFPAFFPNGTKLYPTSPAANFRYCTQSSKKHNGRGATADPRGRAGLSRNPHSPAAAAAAAAAIFPLPGDATTAGHVTAGRDHLAPLWGGMGAGGFGPHHLAPQSRGGTGRAASAQRCPPAPLLAQVPGYRGNGAGAGGARRNGGGRGLFALPAAPRRHGGGYRVP